MPHAPSLILAASFEVSIAPHSYLRPLPATLWCAARENSSPEAWPPLLDPLGLPALPVDASPSAVVGHLAGLAEQCEQAGTVLCFQTSELPLQRLDYLLVDEQSVPAAAPRPLHSWALFKIDTRYEVRFEHGSYGARRQTADTLGAALRILETSLASQPWEAFGDEASQRTLLHKGQFYWAAPSQDIPVDNFVYKTGLGHELKVEAVGDGVILAWRTFDGESAYTLHDDYAQALEQLADVIEGKVTGAQFQESEDEWTGMAQVRPDDAGRFVVQTIFKDGDEHHAETLQYTTGQGHQVCLRSGGAKWEVEATDLGKEPIAQSFVEKADALRGLARALRGEPL